MEGGWGDRGTKDHTYKTILCSTAPVNSDIYKLIIVQMCAASYRQHVLKEEKEQK